MNCTLVLASKSPRRRQLLGELGLPLRFVNINADETVSSSIPSAQVAEAIALRKAEAFDRSLLSDHEVLVTADTVVVNNDTVLGKPHSREEALAMLSGLSGRQHSVYTGVCLLTRNKKVSFTEETFVRFAQLTDAELEYYVDRYKPFDKAGAYGIQEWIGMVGVEGIEGCYYNVMGLPVARLYKELKSLVD